MIRFFWAFTSSGLLNLAEAIEDNIQAAFELGVFSVCGVSVKDALTVDLQSWELNPRRLAVVKRPISGNMWVVCGAEVALAYELMMADITSFPDLSAKLPLKPILLRYSNLAFSSKKL